MAHLAVGLLFQRRHPRDAGFDQLADGHALLGLQRLALAQRLEDILACANAGLQGIDRGAGVIHAEGLRIINTEPLTARLAGEAVGDL